MTLRTLIGRYICAWRQRTGRKPVHADRRCKMALEAGDYTSAEMPVRECQRCGRVVPVKTRKRKGAV